MNKYHNKKTTVNGINFDSKREADRYIELMLLQRAGKITNLKLQPVFTLQEGFITPKGEKVRPITYKADFSYRKSENGPLIVEDVKGVRTKEYLIKKKLMLDKGIEIVEV